MEEIFEINQNTCRICMKESLELKFSLDDCIEMIRTLLSNAEDFSTDPEMEFLPKRVCNACFQMLVVAQDIRNRCLKSHEFFSSLTNKWFTMAKEEFIEPVEAPESVSRCCFCESTFQDVEKLKGHVLKDHELQVLDESVAGCIACGLETNAEGHRTCEVCFQSCENTAELDEHSKVHMEIEEVQYEIVESEASEELVETGPKTKLRYRCCMCSKSSRIKTEMLDHFNTDHKDEILEQGATTGHVCFLCLRGFSSRGELIQHQKAPHQEFHECQTCQTTFSSEYKLQCHNDRQHADQQYFECEICEKVYRKQSSLNHHKYVMHNKANNFHCTECKKTFHRRSFYKDHMNSHRGIKPHACTFCEATFSRRNNLVQHLRKHTGDRPFVCTVCQKTYAHYTDLKRHSFQHTQNWPFLCTVCGKGFPKRSAVVNHLKVHKEGGEYIESCVKD